MYDTVMLCLVEVRCRQHVLSTRRRTSIPAQLDGRHATTVRGRIMLPPASQLLAYLPMPSSCCLVAQTGQWSAWQLQHQM